MKAQFGPEVLMAKIVEDFNWSAVEAEGWAEWEWAARRLDTAEGAGGDDETVLDVVVFMLHDLMEFLEIEIWSSERDHLHER